LRHQKLWVPKEILPSYNYGIIEYFINANDNLFMYATKYNSYLFYLNNTAHATDNDRLRIEPFLMKMYPIKAEFEK